MNTAIMGEVSNIEDSDLYGLDSLIDTTDSIENLKKRLSEIQEEEHNTFKFNNGLGEILVKVIPLPLIIAGIYYQINPSFLALDINGKSASILLSFILVGQMIWQIVLAQRAKGLRLTKANFELQGLIHKRNGRPFHSLEGYVEVNDFLEGEYLQSTLHRFMGFIAICNYLITLIGAVIWQMPYGYSELLATDIEAAPALLALSAGLGTGMTMALWGAVIIDKTVDFDSSKPTGLMHAYAPSSHPTSLQLAFTDILSSIMEPSIYTHFEIYKEFLQTKLKDEKNSIKAFEKILFLIYLNNQNMLKRVDIENEIGEDFEDVEEILSHEIFDYNSLKEIVKRAQELLPGFFRIIDRLQYQLSNNIVHVKAQEIIYDCEIERVIEFEKANLFIFIADNGKVETEYKIEITAPKMLPETDEKNIEFSANQYIDYPEKNKLETLSKEEQDVVGLVGQILGMGKLLWISLQPTVKGSTYINVNISDNGGHLIGGKTMKIECRKNYATALKSQTGKASVLAGAMVPLAKAAPSLRRLIGLP